MDRGAPCTEGPHGHRGPMYIGVPSGDNYSDISKGRGGVSLAEQGPKVGGVCVPQGPGRWGGPPPLPPPFEIILGGLTVPGLRFFSVARGREADTPKNISKAKAFRH